MKRVLLQEAALASSQRLESALDATALDQKQDTAGGNRRARTSAAMLGLALSMGASGVAIAGNQDRANAADLASNKPIVATLPKSSGLDAGSTAVGRRHTVREAETLWDIAQVYGVDATHLASTNGLSVDVVLHVGQVLQVPDTSDIEISEPVALTSGEVATSYESVELERPDDMPAVASEAVLDGMADTLDGLAVEDEQLSQRQTKAIEGLRKDAEALNSGLVELRQTRTETAALASESDRSEMAMASDDVSADIPASNVAATRELAVDSTTAGSEAFERLVSPGPQVEAASAQSQAEALVAKVTPAPVSVSAEIGRDVPSVLPELQLRSPRDEGVLTATDLRTRVEAEDGEVALRNATPAPLEQRRSAPLPDVAYQVQPGDTLSSIARRYNVSLQALADYNRIADPNHIFVGTSLAIPAQSNEAAVPSQAVQRPSVEVAARGSTPGLLGSRLSETPEQELAIGLQSSLLRSNSSASTAEQAGAIDSSEQDFADSMTMAAAQPNNADAEPTFYAERLLLEVREMRAQRSQIAPTDVAAADSSDTEMAVVQPAEPVEVAIANPSAPVAVPDLDAVDGLNPRPAGLPQEPSERSITSPSQLLAAAPIGSEQYAPLTQPSAGQVVSPDLPALPGSEEFLPGDPMSNGYVWPAEGVFTSGYGWRWGRMHRGIDVAAPVGTPIVASASGVVISSGWNSGGFGNLVELRHADGTLTRYAHNSRLLVRPGQRVRQGQQIAEMGSTGYSTGPHVHFEIHPPNQGAVNPMAFLPGR